MIDFPYVSDTVKHHDYFPGEIRRSKNGKFGDLAGYVIENNSTLYVTRDTLPAHIVPQGKIPEACLGVPMFSQDKLIRLVVVQSYQPGSSYSADLNILVIDIHRAIAKHIYADNIILDMITDDQEHLEIIYYRDMQDPKAKQPHEGNLYIGENHSSLTA